MPKCVYLIFFCLPLGLNAQLAGYKFLRFDTKNGLSHNQVNCFFKDQQGFLWIGTQSGLNRFDGYTFKTFRNNLHDTSSLANDYVYRIFEDPAGKLWISNRQTYTIYDPQMEQFHRNADAWAQRYGLPNSKLTKIQKSRSGDYWINHTQAGLCRYDNQQGRLIKTMHSPLDTTTIIAAQITDFQEDGNGLVWLVHNNGILECLDPISNKVVSRNNYLESAFPNTQNNFELFVDSDNDVWVYTDDVKGGYFFDARAQKFYPFNTSSGLFQIRNNIIRAIAQDIDGLIWIATDHGGITQFDKKKKSTAYLIHNPDDANTISQNSIISLYKDPTGIMWVGTYKRGFNIYHKNIFKFPLYQITIPGQKGVQISDINRFAEDSKGNLWIGTNGAGLVYFNRSTGQYTRYRNIPGNPNSLCNDVVVSLCIDHEQNLWIGTYFGGLDRFDGKNFTHFTHNPDNPGSLSDDRIWEILEDSRHNLWVGTLRGGLNLFDRQRKVFRHYRPRDTNSVCSDYISALMEDSEGNLWIGTEQGIDMLDHATGIFKHFGARLNSRNTLSDNAVTSILEDARGNIWIGTLHGLNLFDKKEKSFRVFDKSDGLADDAILTILEDNHQGLWMSTPNGLSHLAINSWEGRQPGKISVRCYNEFDGLQAREFNNDAACKTRQGELVFGGPNGFNIIYPEKIEYFDEHPKILLTDFQIFNRSVRPAEQTDKKILLDRSITDTRAITLEYNQNVFSIEFAALSFIHPEKNLYQYKLEGFNNEWFTVDPYNRKVTYTNLDPGRYTFHVRVAKEHGNWSEARRLQITIRPPCWRTPLAYFLYALALGAVLVFARWAVLDRARTKFNIEQQRLEAQRIHALDSLKIKFLTNISHEFRTPLSLILTPLERLIKTSAGSGMEAQLSMIYRNAQNLLHLVNQLLDFKKLEVAETTFIPDHGDIIAFIRDISHSFSALFDNRVIRFSFTSEVDALYMIFDQEKLSRSMYNLLSNAFKFTPPNGNVAVRVQLISPDQKLGAEWLEIQVADTGIGIPEEIQDKIFDRFFQQEMSGERTNPGSGIGLSITKEFIQLHGGAVTVKSRVGEGSVFTVRLPVLRASLPIKEVAPAKYPPAAGTVHLDNLAGEKFSRPLVLLVEDNEEFRTYLREALSQQYEIIEAANGRIALDLVQQRIPDLVISDVMMPEMDGIELCRRIKTDWRTSHIPAILLSARTAEERQLEGYETGADIYLTKPFLLDILLIRMQKLIAQGKHPHPHPSKQIDVQPKEIVITSLDEQLILKAVEIVEKNISNTDFSVEELSHGLSMSRVYLYKKLLALTGKTPIEFIRVIRLKRAAQLLAKSQLTIAEVAYKVGFNNPKYFSRHFKEEFGMLPAAFQKKSGKGPSNAPG